MNFLRQFIHRPQRLWVRQLNFQVGELVDAGVGEFYFNMPLADPEAIPDLYTVRQPTLSR